MTTPGTVDARWLAGQVDDVSARGIAVAVAALIRQGRLAAGTRLPTVRELGVALGVSPATVSEAWSLLRRRRSIAGRGRGGTVVTGPPDVPRPYRFEGVGRFGARLEHDLRLAVPDPALLPPLDLALAQALRTDQLNEYVRVPITRQLAGAVTPAWPFRPDALLAVNGGFDGLMLLLQSLLLPGDPVAVEEPSAPRLLDLLDEVGAEVLEVACDDRGPRPDALATALHRRPVLFMYQPRAHSPRGHHVDAARRDELAALLAPTTTSIVENDGLGALANAEPASIGTVLPARTVMVRSYSKPYGPDLRLAVVGGAATLVEKARVYRTFGSGWTSRILQNCLAALLTDPAVDRSVAHAREVYRSRREALAGALARRGMACGSADGLAVWVPVRDERTALVTLAAAGVAVAAGSQYHHGPHQPHIRAATGRLTADPDAIADLIALAVTEGEAMD
jgi:DNA-binding transcriptional MocR family regulator